MHVENLLNTEDVAGPKARAASDVNRESETQKRSTAFRARWVLDTFVLKKQEKEKKRHALSTYRKRQLPVDGVKPVECVGVCVFEFGSAREEGG